MVNQTSLSRCGSCPRFSPDALGMQASSALVWLVLEIFVILATLYVTAIQTNIKTLDLLAFASYKYVG